MELLLIAAGLGAIYVSVQVLRRRAQARQDDIETQIASIPRGMPADPQRARFLSVRGD